MKNTIWFRTEDQRNLFMNEIKGQISDGQWENARPHNHWQMWCDADVKVDPANPGRNFYPIRTCYNLVAPDLLSVIGQRMIVQVKLGRAFGTENVNLMEKLFEFSAAPGGTDRWERFVFCGIPEWITNAKGEYYNDLRAKLANIDMAKVVDAINNDSYDMKALKADLREMKEAMRTMRS